MAIWFLSALFASVALGHTGVKTLLIDGNLYPPFDSRIDPFLGQVRRIEWSHDIVGVTFNPITNFSDPSLACRENSRPPALKAPVRAGAEISFFWTPITRMHNGPAISYLARNDDPKTPATKLKFFKIFEKGFDAAKDRWANEEASDNGDSFKIQLPSDIKPGPYVLRTELIALHGNMAELKAKNLQGQIQIYPHCFNIDVIGSGNATPEGVSFPGAYKPTEPGFTFRPFMTYGNNIKGGTEHNKNYVPPGPPLYKGRYDAPTGPQPEPTETGFYPPDLETTYMDLIRKIERPALKLATYINTAWPHYKADAEVMAAYGKLGAVAGKESAEVSRALKPDIEAFKRVATGKD